MGFFVVWVVLVVTSLMQSLSDRHHNLLSTVMEKEEDGWKTALLATELVVLMDSYMVMVMHEPEAYAWTQRPLSAHRQNRICLSLPSWSFHPMSHALATTTISVLTHTTHYPHAVPPLVAGPYLGGLPREITPMTTNDDNHGWRDHCQHTMTKMADNGCHDVPLPVAHNVGWLLYAAAPGVRHHGSCRMTVAAMGNGARFS